jgi:uncharacterized repeat protein (TIGR03803 family)
MHSAQTNSETKNRLNVSDVGPGFRPTKLAAAIIRGAVTLAVLSALLIAARPAQAQTESVLYNFTGTPDGANPYGGLTLNGGNFFGTTYAGGLYGFGTVYELVPNGSGGWTESVLYSFCPASPSCTDGEYPAFGSVIFDTAGNLYGTTYAGGANGNGEVFKLSPSGETWKQTVVYSFGAVPDAANPVNGLIMDKSGNLYGTAYNGGGGESGAVFELSPNGSGGWTEQVISPINSLYGGLAMNSAGDLFGTTADTVFELQPNGTGGWLLTTLFTFTSAHATTQGEEPNGTVVLDSAGNIYGTTVEGGKNSEGAVYKLTLGTNGKYTEKLLYSFGPNGTAPWAGLVFDTTGNLYGTTKTGGKNGAGVVYELVSDNGAYIERVLQTFAGENGAVPYDGLIYSGGYLYGTTFEGGDDGMGIVFVVNPAAAVTKTTCVSSVNPSTQGEAVTFTATITPAPPNGEVVVFQPVGQSTMTNGVATFTVSDLKVGSTTITAVYYGDLNFVGSKSVSFSQVVTK